MRIAIIDLGTDTFNLLARWRERSARDHYSVALRHVIKQNFTVGERVS